VLPSTLPNPNARPYPAASWQSAYHWTAWTNSNDRDFDMMLVTLDRRIGDTTGVFGRAGGGSELNRNLQLSGYPGDKPRYEQWWSGGTVSAETAYRVDFDHDIVPGSSGSPLWEVVGNDRFIRAVLSTENAATNRGVRMNRGKFDTISGWIAADP